MTTIRTHGNPFVKCKRARPLNEVVRDHSLFMTGGGLIRMKGGGSPKILGSLREGHRKYANRCVRGHLIGSV